MNNYVITKLLSGETLMAEVVNSDKYRIYLKRPVQVRMVPIMKDGRIAEEPVISIYCQFTYEEDFDIKHEMVVFCKPLINSIVPFYIKTANDMYEVEVTNVSMKEYDQGIDALKEESTFTIVDLDKSKIVH